MTPRIPRTLCALALGAALTAAARDAHAGPIPYGTIGSVNTPIGGVPNLVYFNGTTGTFDPAHPGSIDLGNFVVSSLTKQTGTPDVTFTNDPFSVVVYSGAQQSVQVNGNLNGITGPTATNPSLSATFTSITPYGSSPLPFNIALPLNTPVSLALSDGTGPASTIVTAAASPVPEPSTVAVFAAALGGLGLWHRRRAR
jgi:hypothetical protein